MRKILACAVLTVLVAGSVSAQRSDLSGLKFCIDPGHGGHSDANDRHLIPDPGVDFWESESNFQKALLLKSLLEAQGANVILTRYTNDYPNDADEPSLAARVALANANNVDWFHSIHSNATGLSVNNSINYTLMLVREMRPGGPSSGSGNGLGVPETPEAWDISLHQMAPNIQSIMRTQPPPRTFLDWTFYGGTNGGFSLGVLRGLLMPGELSEGEMHDYFPETRRLMNNDYRKMEAYALRNSFMQYFQVPADTKGIIAGIQSEVATNKLINYSKVRLLPENLLYNGDRYNNGFYMFDNLQAGPHTVRFETPGYTLDSVATNVLPGGVVFLDRTFESFTAPTILTSIPSQGDTLFSAATPITIQFSKPMNTATVQASFSITPSVSGRFSWTNTNSTMVFRPDSVLTFFVNYTVRIDTSAHSAGGQTLDGNGDGTAGDPYVLRFRTRDVDVVPPKILVAYPAADATLLSPTAVLNVTFDEHLNPATVSATNFVVQKIAGSVIIPRTLRYWEVGEKGGVNIYLATPLEPGAAYRLRISGVTDVVGNAIPNTAPILWQFSVAPVDYRYTTLETFDTSVDNWFQPGTSGSTVGIDSATFAFDTTRIPTIASDLGSAQLRYSWSRSATDWLLREYLSSGAPRAVQFRKENTVLQAYVNGDGSGNQFRFAIDDSVDAFPAGTAANHEVSKWYTLDWVGWKPVEWDLEVDSVGTWLGNGILEGALRFDSFQLRYVAGTGSLSGRLYFDQLQLGTKIPLAVNGDRNPLPGRFTLDQNYPNPFNPSTKIVYEVPEGPGSSHATSLRVYDLLGREVRTLVNGQLAAGRYTAEFNAEGLASGVYIYRLESGGKSLARKMLLTK